MKRSFLVTLCALAALALVLAQQQNAQYPSHVPFEVRSLFPHESPPGIYQQVDQREIQALADQGFELVSVMPYIYRNEERGSNNPKNVVTQTYPAYFFKRARMIR
jgi:hypothetical protein